MNNEVEFSTSAHNLLLKTGVESTAHQTHKNHIASIQASPQTAKKKRFTKLNITTLKPTQMDNVTAPAPNVKRMMADKTPRLAPPTRPRDRLTHQLLRVDSPMIEKPLTLASLNVRSLRDNSPKPKEITAWLASLPAPSQILLIHEHHLRKEGIHNSAKGIEYWKGSSFWNKGIPMGRSQRISACTSILVDRMIAPLVKERKILIEGRAQYITLQLPNNGSLTIVNIYTTRSSNNRALIRKISQARFTSDHIIPGGNFNHLEETSRRGTSSERQMHRREAAS